MIRLYGYPDNVWTDAAVESLRVSGLVDFEMKSAPEGVNWDNPSPMFRRMPTLTLVSPDKEYLLASGIDEIRELIGRVGNEPDDGLRAFLLANGLKKEEIDALWDCPDCGGHQEGQSET